MYSTLTINIFSRSTKRVSTGNKFEHPRVTKTDNFELSIALRKQTRSCTLILYLDLFYTKLGPLVSMFYF